MDTDAHFDLGQTVLPVLLIHRRHGQLHRYPAGDRALCIVLLPDRSAKEDKDCIADELIDRALILLDDRDHGGEVAIEQGDDPFRRQTLRQRGEAAEVGHQHRDLALFPSHSQSRGRFKNSGNDLICQISAEGLANESVVLLNLLGELLEVALGSLAIGDVRPGTDDVLRLAFLVGYDREAVLHPDIVAPPVPKAVLDGPASLGDQPFDLLEDALGILRMDMLGPEDRIVAHLPRQIPHDRRQILTHEPAGIAVLRLRGRVDDRWTGSDERL